MVNRPHMVPEKGDLGDHSGTEPLEAWWIQATFKIQWDLFEPWQKCLSSVILASSNEGWWWGAGIQGERRYVKRIISIDCRPRLLNSISAIY